MRCLGFFETFLLSEHVDGYEPYDPDWAFLFNSYYESHGERNARFNRGMISRPSLDEVLAYRAHVNAAMEPPAPPVSDRDPTQ